MACFTGALRWLACPRPRRVPAYLALPRTRDERPALHRQFGNRSAYAYSIQTPDKKKAIGAFFINRPDFGEASEPVPEEANKEWYAYWPPIASQSARFACAGKIVLHAGGSCRWMCC